MRITERDVRLIRDIALSHVLSRDQILALGYYSSVTRLNSRLRELSAEHLVKRLESPFFGQSLYMAGRSASQVAGANVERLILSRASSPRFIQHALSTTNVRIALQGKGTGQWRFEQQLRLAFTTDRQYEIRPDGMFLRDTDPLLIEVDLGHVNPSKFREKLRVYRTFVKSGTCQVHFGTTAFDLLVVTTGHTRSRRLSQLMPQNPGFSARFTTFDELAVPRVSSWS